MNTGLTARVALLAVLGLVVAAGIGLMTNAIAGDSIGLSASPIEAGRDLAPPAARSGSHRGEGSHKARHKGRSHHHRGGGGAVTTAPTATVPPVTTTAATTTTSDDAGFDDNSGSDNSGPGSSSSGSGSSGSGSDD